MKPGIVAVAVILAAAGTAAYLLLGNDREFLYAGTVEATQIDLSSRLTAVIGAVTVREGDIVRQGDVLVRLSVEDIAVAAEAAERDFQRAQELLKAGSMNREQYDRVKLKRDDLRVRLGWSSVAAPIGGTVIARYHEPGEMVTPGTKLLALADLGRVWAYVYVPQPMLAKLSTGMNVSAAAGEGGKTFEGEIVRINDEAEFTPKNVQTRKERTRLVYGIKIEFDNTGGFLKPGMTVEVKLPETES